MRLPATTTTLIVLAASTPGTALAAGDSSTPITAAPINGPVVGQGGEALWAVAQPDGEGFTLLAAKPGGPVRTVQGFPTYKTPDGHEVYLSPRLSSAGTRVALAIDEEPIAFDRYDIYEGPAGADVLSGPFGGPLESLLQCRPGIRVAPTAAQTDHGTVMPGPDCDSARAGGLALRGDDGQVRPLTPSGSDAQAAGPFAAWIAHSGEIVVYDTASASVAYRITLPRGAQPAAWDLQDDGKVALALAPDSSHGATLAWYSPDDPAPHPVALPPAQYWDVHIAGDRIAYLRSHNGAHYRGYYFGDLGVADLAGGARTISRRAIGVDGSHPAFGFDGSALAWTGPACSGAVLHSEPVDGSPRALEGARPRCPLRFEKRPRLLGKEAIRVHPRCTGFVLPDCFGSDVKLVALKGRLKLGSDETRFCDGAADVGLGRRGKALVRKFKSLRVMATVKTLDADGKLEVRSATFTLRKRDRIRDTSACEDEF
jgi:hypothetical protein